MKTTKFDQGKCPTCLIPLTAVTDPFGQRRPKPHDLTVCLECLTWLTFNDDLTIRRLSQEELDTLPPDAVSTLMKLTAGMGEMKKKHPFIGR